MNNGFGFADFLFLLNGCMVTLTLTFWAIALGTLTGAVLGLLRTIIPAWASVIFGSILDVFRSVPLLIQFVLANVLKSMLDIQASTFALCCLVLGIYTAAFFTEIVRGAILSVAATTRRAARSLGMNYWQDMAYIVFPIALRVGLPSWVGLTLGVMKDTSIVVWLGVTELMKSSQILVTRLHEPLFILTVCGALYFVMGYPLSKLGYRIEERWKEQ